MINFWLDSPTWNNVAQLNEFLASTQTMLVISVI